MKIKKDTYALTERFLTIKRLLAETELNTSSMDLQIDKYLQSYEKASQKSNNDKLTLTEYFSFLFEDEADELINKLLKSKSDDSGKDDDKQDKDDTSSALDISPEELEEPAPKKKEAPKADTNAAKPAEDVADEASPDVAQDDLSQIAPPTEQSPQEEQPAQKQRPGEIDVDVFASKVSNLVNNAESLLDIKSVIINRAYEIVKTNYSDKEAMQFKNSLATKHKLKTADTYDKPY